MQIDSTRDWEWERGSITLLIQAKEDGTMMLSPSSWMQTSHYLLLHRQLLNGFLRVSYWITNDQTLKIVRDLRCNFLIQWNKFSWFKFVYTLVKQVSVYLTECNFNDQKVECGEFFGFLLLVSLIAKYMLWLDFMFSLGININISDKVDGILQWNLAINVCKCECPCRNVHL